MPESGLVQHHLPSCCQGPNGELFFFFFFFGNDDNYGFQKHWAILLTASGVQHWESQGLSISILLCFVYASCSL